MLKQELNKKIKNTPLQFFLNELNYNSKQKIKNALDKFINCESIDKWLNSGFYDLVYSAEDLFISLCNVLKINGKEVSIELNKSKELRDEIERFKDSYLFVNTNFKRKGEPILALAFCEGKRRISLYKDKKYLFSSLNEILNMVSIEIIKHYIFNDGKASIWGKIENYQLHLFGEIYTFDTKGNILNTNENFDTNIASLELKNKSII
jgi:hypothetical protein